eukprot:6239903-Ditylum_brightwellii.AAC.1
MRRERVSRINRSGGRGPAILYEVLCAVAGVIVCKNVYFVTSKIGFICHCTLLRMLRFSDAIAPSDGLAGSNLFEFIRREQ